MASGRRPVNTCLLYLYSRESRVIPGDCMCYSPVSPISRSRFLLLVLFSVLFNPFLISPISHRNYLLFSVATLYSLPRDVIQHSFIFLLSHPSIPLLPTPSLSPFVSTHLSLPLFYPFGSFCILSSLLLCLCLSFIFCLLFDVVFPLPKFFDFCSALFFPLNAPTASVETFWYISYDRRATDMVSLLNLLR